MNHLFLLFVAGWILSLTSGFTETGIRVHPAWTLNDTDEFVVVREEGENGPRFKAGNSLGPVLTARSVMLIDVDSGAVLYEKDADGKRSIASITKLMTALVALPYLTPDSVVEIEKNDVAPVGVGNFFEGDRIKAEDLFAAMLVASDNTAAQALARSTGLNHDAFIAAMNAEAERLHMSGTRFADVTGLSAENVSTAREIMILSAEAFSRERIRNLTQRRSVTVRTEKGDTSVLRTTNWLIGGIYTVRAGKTGFVTDAGYNIVAELTDGAHPLRGVVLGSSTNDDRFQDLKMLAAWTWQNYEWQDEMN